MPTYYYECSEKHAFSLEQPHGSPKECPCNAPGCPQKAQRVLRPLQEATMDCPTPGACCERARDNRNADVVMTEIRKNLGKPPKEDADDRAADRHWGKKNGLVKGPRKRK